MEPFNTFENFCHERDKKEQEKRDRKKDRRDSFRFWLTLFFSAVAALASVAGVLIQVLSLRQ